MAHTLEGGPVAKKRRKGGIRQRLSESMPALLAEEGNDDDSQQHQASSSSRAPPVAKMPSKLVQNLLKDFAWGGMSAQKLQEICQCSVQDLKVLRKVMADEGLPLPQKTPVEKDQEAVASIGVGGQYSNKCYSDLMKKVEGNISLPQPYRTIMKFAKLGDQVQEMLLPREMFSAFFQYKATWKKVVVPDQSLLLKFWKAQELHPQWKGHPVESLTNAQLKMVVPISLHGDEVPVTGIGKQWSRKMVNFSWHSLISTTASVQDSQFFIWALFDKAGLNGDEETEEGYNTLWKFFEILAWSLDSLFKGTYPTHDVHGHE